MSFLGGNIFTFQVDRGLVLQLIEANMTLLGNSLIPPLELPVGKITSPLTGSLPRVDLAVSGIDLVFEVGTNLATLNLALSGAVIRLDKDIEATFQTGTLKVALMFVDGTFMMVRQTGIAID